MGLNSQRAQLSRRSRASGFGGNFDIGLSVEGRSGQIGLALRGALQDEFDAITQAVSTAQFQAVEEVVTRGKEMMRADMASSGFRNAGRLSKTWRGKAYSKSLRDGESGAQAVIWSAAPEIVAAFDDGGAISSPKGFMMIPYGRAKAIYRQTKSWKNRKSASTGRFKKAEPWVGAVERRLNVKIVPIFSKDKSRAILVAQDGGKFRKGTRLVSGTNIKKKEVLGFLVKEVRPGRRMKGRALLRQVLESGAQVMDQVFVEKFFALRPEAGGA